MNLFRVMEISGSALMAERMRAEVTSANLANAETTHTDEGGPFQRKEVVFSGTSISPFRSVMTSQDSAAESEPRVEDIDSGLEPWAGEFRPQVKPFCPSPRRLKKAVSKRQLGRTRSRAGVLEKSPAFRPGFGK